MTNVTQSAEVEVAGDHAYIFLQPKEVHPSIDYQVQLTHDSIAIRVDYDRTGKLIGIDIIGFR